MVPLAQYLLSQDPDLQEELERTQADVDRYLEPIESDMWQELEDETAQQRVPLDYFQSGIADAYGEDVVVVPDEQLND